MYWRVLVPSERLLFAEPLLFLLPLPALRLLVVRVRFADEFLLVSDG